MLFAVAALAGGCDAKRITTTVGSAVIQTRTTSLRVGDTVTVRAGVLYKDGRFQAFPTPTYNAGTASVLTVHNTSGLIRAVAAGSSTVLATQPGAAQVDTLFTVTP